MAAGSAGVLIGFSSTILTLLITSGAGVLNQRALVATLVLLVFAIVFFSSATDFYVTGAWRASTIKEYNTWGLRGSKAYGLGMGWLVVSIGTMFLALVSPVELAYLPPSLFLGSWVVLFAVRKNEPDDKTRWAFRAAMFAQIAAGLILIRCLGGA